jgi:hypothetical protein
VSYNVDTAEIVRGELRMRHESYLAWREREEELPEIHPFHEDDSIEQLDEDRRFVFQDFWWGGIRSSEFYYETLPLIAADLEGDADVLFTWEGGDSHTIVRFKDGKAVEHKVVFAAGEATKNL